MSTTIGKITGKITLALALLGTPHSVRAQAKPQPKFEVASVHENKSEGHSSMNVDPTSGDSFTPVGGLYSAKNIVLVSYISFAYKLTNLQLQSVVAQVPWISEARFDIEARAEGSPTKDQFRLMMQSLLMERFHLAVHKETRQVPILKVLLIKPDKFGPQLRLHSQQDATCSGLQDAEPAEDGFPTRCGAISRMKPSAPGRIKRGGRDVPMALFASVLTGVGNLGRPLLDQTGLHNNVDFSMEWAQVAANVPPGSEFHPDESAPPFEEALKEQLGLKLVAGKGPAEFFLVDHIEHLSEN